MQITRQNVDELLDAHKIEVHMRNGAWWEIRRNGKTQLWKSQPGRIRIPFKYGFKGYGALTTEDFKTPEGHRLLDNNLRFRDLSYGALNTIHFRVKPSPEMA